MAFPFDEQWNLIMNSSVFAEGPPDWPMMAAPLRGVFISGTFEEDSSAPYAPKMYVDREFFRFSMLQLKGKLDEPFKKVLVGASLRLIERGRLFRVFSVIGKDNGDLEVELQEVDDGE